MPLLLVFPSFGVDSILPNSSSPGSTAILQDKTTGLDTNFVMQDILTDKRVGPYDPAVMPQALEPVSHRAMAITPAEQGPSAGQPQVRLPGIP